MLESRDIRRLLGTEVVPCRFRIHQQLVEGFCSAKPVERAAAEKKLARLEVPRGVVIVSGRLPITGKLSGDRICAIPAMRNLDLLAIARVGEPTAREMEHAFTTMIRATPSSQPIEQWLHHNQTGCSMADLASYGVAQNGSLARRGLREFRKHFPSKLIYVSRTSITTMFTENVSDEMRAQIAEHEPSGPRVSHEFVVAGPATLLRIHWKMPKQRKGGRV